MPCNLAVSLLCIIPQWLSLAAFMAACAPFRRPAVHTLTVKCGCPVLPAEWPPSACPPKPSGRLHRGARRHCTCSATRVQHAGAGDVCDHLATRTQVSPLMEKINLRSRPMARAVRSSWARCDGDLRVVKGRRTYRGSESGRPFLSTLLYQEACWANTPPPPSPQAVPSRWGRRACLPGSSSCPAIPAYTGGYSTTAAATTRQVGRDNARKKCGQLA